MRIANTGKQQAQVIVNFCDGANRRARVVRSCFLFDGNGRRQALRSGRHPVFPLTARIVWHTRTVIRHSGAALRHTAYRMRVTICRSRIIPVMTTSLLRGRSRLIFFRLWVRAPRIFMDSISYLCTSQPVNIPNFLGISQPDSCLLQLHLKKCHQTEMRATIGLAGVYGLRMFGLFIILPVFAFYAEDLPGGRQLHLESVSRSAPMV
jgi:hypothetical protein